MSFVTEDALRGLVEFSNDALNIKAVYKESILNADAVDVVEEEEEGGILNKIKSFFNFISLFETIFIIKIKLK